MSKTMSNNIYKPDALLSGGALQKPFETEEGVPKTGNIVPTLLRLAMRRLPGFGYGMIHGGHAPSVVKNAVTIGSHGAVK